MISPTSFPAFFEALWGYAPFDWQTRLLEIVHNKGWPTTLDLPTGSGKTVTLDVALFALALDASRPVAERRQPRRIVLVVDRRVVVDQGYERAVAIANKLTEAKDGILADVAKALRELSGDPTGFPVLPAVLRGGMPRESEWAKSPSQPVIMTSTVDQVGSRLLFRGYGVSERMRSVHAGLLGCDTLLLLDEVHLARPFEDTLSALTRWYGGNPEGLVRPLTFVRMSATVATDSEDTFRLEQKDRDNRHLNERLAAKKQAVLRQLNTPRDPVKAGEALAKAAVKETQRLAKGTPRAVAVIVNRVETARKIASLAQTDMGEEWSVRLLTGRMRPLDRLERQAAILDHVVAGRTRTPDSPKLLLVSTQAIEAGADFDFDALVTECASLDALRQRFGRLDRLGKLGSTEAVILAGSSSVDEKAEPDPIYGVSLRETWRWLNLVGASSAEQDARIVDFGIDAIDALMKPLDVSTMDQMTAPRAIAPVLTSSHLDRWVQTSPAPHADPEVGPFLHGLGRSAPEVQLVWRADVTAATLNDTDESEQTIAGLRKMLELVRPGSLEALAVPLWTAKKWLSEVYSRQNPSVTISASKEDAALADVEGQLDVAVDVVDLAPALAWRGDELQLIRSAKDIRPGATLIVPSEYGGLDPHFDCWDPESTTSVKDRGDEAHLLQRGRPVLRWSPAVIASWAPFAPELVKRGPQVTKADLDEDGALAEQRAFREWRQEMLGVPDIPDWARVALKHLESRTKTQAIALSTAKPNGEMSNAWRATYRPHPIPASQLRELFQLPSLRRVLATDGVGEAATEGDEGSFLGSEISLTKHLHGVRDFAKKFGKSLHLHHSLMEDLALAGLIHDLGKADPRFQLLLHGGDPVREAAASELLAKSSVNATDQAARERARERSGYPKGMRHELLSVALVENDDQLRQRAGDWDLVLHLIGSHHGWCRPFAPPIHDPEPQAVSVTIDGMSWSASSAHDLSRFDSPIAERFWSLTRKYGYWGLAWLEAILRLADHRESERESAKEKG